MQFDNLSFCWVILGQGIEQVVHLDDFIRRRTGRRDGSVQLDTVVLSATFDSTFAPRSLDKNPSHCLGSCRKEVAISVPLLIVAHKTQIGFVYECRSLQSLPWGFPLQLATREATQLIVDNRY